MLNLLFLFRKKEMLQKYDIFITFILFTFIILQFFQINDIIRTIMIVYEGGIYFGNVSNS